MKQSGRPPFFYCTGRDVRVLGREVRQAQWLLRKAVSSTQVLQEYFSVATRKLRIPPDVAQQKVHLMASMSVIAIDVAHIIEAIKLHRLYSLSFWDALIIQAARVGDCKEGLTEDMQAGQVVENVLLRNPFL